MNFKTILRGIWVMTPAILLIWWVVIIWNKFMNATSQNDTFSVQSSIQTNKDNLLENECPYKLTLIGNGIVDYTPSDHGWVYDIIDWEYEINCTPHTPEYNNILIWSNAGSDIIVNPSNYSFSIQNSPYKWLCMAYSWCSWDINVITWWTICGNGVLENGEQCDDWNTQNWDGCDSICMIEISSWARYDCVEIYTWSYSVWYHCIESEDGKYTNPMCNNDCGKIPYCGDNICQSSEKDKYGNILCKLDCKWPITPEESQELNVWW